MSSIISIRQSISSDKAKLWELCLNVINDGNAFMFDESFQFHEFNQYWFGNKASTFTALIGNEVVGSYVIRPNQPGYGSHVANGSYLVNVNFRGKGLGEFLGNHSKLQAKTEGYIAMQFNAVISTNVPAVNLWKKLGFKINGTNIKAFRHKKLGNVDTYTMYCEL